MEHGERLALAALRLQLEWGADEALGEQPLDRVRGHAPADDEAPPAPARASLRSEGKQVTPALPAARMAQAAAAAAGTLAALRAAIEGL